MPRTAALLCIRNEADRLGWWIAHHVAAGFTALLVCDDHSTDGSRDILAQAARNYDIRLLETSRRETDRQKRHRDALQLMVRQEGQHFDWIIQLAIDEYFLPAGGSVPAFLAAMQEHMGAESFRQARHLPVNWCMTGLNRQEQQARFDVQLPHPRALFLSHAPATFPDHRVTRDFFRPDREGTIPDPFAHVDTAPDWSHARILHDAASNSRTPQTRRYYNRNDELFPEGQALLPRTLDHAAHILQGLILAACYALQNGQDEASDAPPALPSPKLPPLLRRFHLHQGEAMLALERSSRSITLHPAGDVHADENLTPLCLLQMDNGPAEAGPSCGILYAESPAPTPSLPVCPSALTYFPALLDCLPVQLTTAHEGTVQLALLPMNLPLPGGRATVLTRRPSPTPPGEDSLLAGVQHFTAGGLSADGLRKSIRDSSWLAPSVIGALYALLPADEARTLFTPLLHRLFHGWKR